MTAPAPFFDGTQLCAQTDPEAFFPEKGGSAASVKALCRRCEFVTECLEYALRWDVEGVWGATSPEDRKRIRRARGIAANPMRPSQADIRAAQIDRLFALGFTLQQIADQLGVTRSTVNQARVRGRSAA